MVITPPPLALTNNLVIPCLYTTVDMQFYRFGLKLSSILVTNFWSFLSPPSGRAYGFWYGVGCYIRELKFPNTTLIKPNN